MKINNSISMVLIICLLLSCKADKKSQKASETNSNTGVIEQPIQTDKGDVISTEKLKKEDVIEGMMQEISEKKSEDVVQEVVETADSFYIVEKKVESSNQQSADKKKLIDKKIETAKAQVGSSMNKSKSCDEIIVDYEKFIKDFIKNSSKENIKKLGQWSQDIMFKVCYDKGGEFMKRADIADELLED